MVESKSNGRQNQRRRTRKDLMAAAGRLLKNGVTPSMDEVAEEAMVSRATAYRYFPNLEALLLEAPLDGEVPNPNELFDDDDSNDPAARLDKAESALHDMCYRNVAQLRLMLAASLERSVKESRASGIPLRQNRRMELIETALAPIRDEIPDASYDTLCAALSLVFGVESMIVFSDVLGLDETTARRIKRWSIEALVRHAVGHPTEVEKPSER